LSLFPPSLERLVLILARLPGIGKKSATRIALKLVASSGADCRELARTIIEASEKTIGCSTCGALTESDPCSICSDARRESTVICVVERPSDVIALERTSRYRGRYHVLGGLLSPLDGIGPEDLRLDSLGRRAREKDVSEIILALNPTAEGEATSHYLARLLTETGVRVTKLASGIPVGGDLDLADELTLGTALDERREL
jgi:recombination protein RecR